MAKINNTKGNATTLVTFLIQKKKRNKKYEINAWQNVDGRRLYFWGRSHTKTVGEHFVEAKGRWLSNLVHLQAIISYECVTEKKSRRDSFNLFRINNL